jgi:putative SOS response-associated peptidase YedK
MRAETACAGRLWVKSPAHAGTPHIPETVGNTITSFSIVTTAAAPSCEAYHDRMPLVLEEGQFEDWMRGPVEQAGEFPWPSCK